MKRGFSKVGYGFVFHLETFYCAIQVVVLFFSITY